MTSGAILRCLRPMEAVRREVLAPEPVEALAGMLDVDAPEGGELPPLWHWVYLLERPPQRELGRDGHPLSGVPAPPGPGYRRMFAGGRVVHHRPLSVGEEATRVARLVSTRQKTGRSGPLTFVTVRSEISQRGQVAVVDEQDIVYRHQDSTLPAPSDADPAAPTEPRQPALTLVVDPVLLFRFSALTYNAHRIHYDHEFARQEGYDDLVVHGPLQALMMAELMRRHRVSLLETTYRYRLVAPMTGPQRMVVSAAEGGLDAGAEVRDGRGTLTAVGSLG